MNNVKAEVTRFGRSQKFRLSAKGSDAKAAYDQMLEAARSGNGRAEFEAARQAWSQPRGLGAEDGLFLVEFGTQDKTIAEASRNLDSCGTTPKEVKAAVERLLSCGMMEPVPEVPLALGSPQIAPRRRW